MGRRVQDFQILLDLKNEFGTFDLLTLEGDCTSDFTGMKKLALDELKVCQTSMTTSAVVQL